jgi:hypothetical protein
MKKIMRYRAIISKFALFAMVMVVLGIISPAPADAAVLTSLSDTMSRLKASTLSDHDIRFVTPTGADASSDTITLTFSAGFTLGTFAVANLDLAVSASSACTTFPTEKTLAASAGAGTWGAAQSGQVITLTAPTDATTGEITAGRCVQVQIGANATAGAAGASIITNGATGSSDTVAVAGTFGDTGTAAVEIITNDQVTISATVDPTISFAISANAATFGTLASGTGRWATGAGANASAGTDPTSSNTAHTLTMSTNAASGYVVTYNGATLTSAGNTIAPATITGDSDGTPGTPQFALCGKATTGSPTVTAGYVCGTNSDYNFAASTATTLVTKSTPVSGDVVSVAYLANISGATPAGSYTTALAYVATGTY